MISVLTCIMNGYDTIRDSYYDPDIQYVCVTDDRNITNPNWKIIYVDSNWKTSNAKYKYVKFHPFEFVDGDFCVYIDSTVMISEDGIKLIKYLYNSGYNLGLVIHPKRTTAQQELSAWVERRDFDESQYEIITNLYKGIRNDIGLFFCCIILYRKTDGTKYFGDTTYKLLNKYGLNGDVCRSDQALIPYALNETIMNTKMSLTEILAMSSELLFNYFTRYSRVAQKTTFFNPPPFQLFFGNIIQPLNSSIIKTLKIL